MQIKKIPESELFVMQYIWSKEEDAVASTEILKNMQEKYEWKKSTVLTFLTRLTKRGFLETSKKDRFTYYTALVREEDYLKVETKSFFSLFHNNSMKSLMSALHDDEEISEKDLKEFEKWINEMKE